MRGIKEEANDPKPETAPQDEAPEGEGGTGEPPGKKPKVIKKKEEKKEGETQGDPQGSAAGSVPDLEKMLAEARAAMGGSALPA